MAPRTRTLRLASVLTALLPVAAASTLARQETPEPTPDLTGPAIPTHTLGLDVTAPAFQDLDDGVVWVRGGDFKAAFGPEGCAFVPFLGSSAPRNFPLRLAPVRLSVGGEPVALDPVSGAVRGGQRVTLERGGLREVYRVSPGSVEQTFELDRAPGAGAWALEVPVAGELEYAGVEDGTLRFRNALGGVDYGVATMVDARGLRTPLATTWTGEAIRLEVPAELASTLSYPLVVDPVISTFALTAGGPDQRVPRTVFDVTEDAYVAVYEEVFSASDVDVAFHLYDAQGPVGPQRYADLTDQDSRTPDVGWSGGADRACFVWSALETGWTAHRIVGRTWSSAAGFEPPFEVSTPGQPGNPDMIHPAIGGHVNLDKVLVVWERVTANGAEHEIWTRDVDLLTMDLGFELVAYYMEGVARNPDVGEIETLAAGFDGKWLIVWEQEDPGGTSIRGQYFHTDGYVDSGFDVDVGAGSPRSRPRVSSGAIESHFRDMVVLFEVDRGSHRDTRAALVRRQEVLDVITLGDPALFVDQRVGGVDSDGTRFVATFAEGPAGTGPWDLRVVTLLPIAQELLVSSEGPVTVATGVAGDAGDVAATVQWPVTSPLDPDRFGLVQESWSGTDRDVLAADYERADQVVGVEFCLDQVPTATGVPAKLLVAGEPSFGGSLVLYCTDVSPGHFGYFLCSMAQGFVAQPGGAVGNLCLGGDIGRFVSLTQPTGPSPGEFWIDAYLGALPYATPVAALPGETWYFQAWFRDSPSPTSNFSTGVAVTIQ